MVEVKLINKIESLGILPKHPYFLNANDLFSEENKFIALPNIRMIIIASTAIFKIIPKKKK